MKQWIVIGGIAVLVLMASRKAMSGKASPEYAFDPQNWKTLPGYIAAQGRGFIA